MVSVVFQVQESTALVFPSSSELKGARQEKCSVLIASATRNTDPQH